MHARRRSRPVLLAAALFATAAAQAGAQTAPPAIDRAEFRRFAEAAMTDWKVPGMAVALVKDNAVVLTETFGRRDVDGGQPVTPRTLFGIGCLTKAFTATAIGLLVDDGLVAWNRPVADYIPEFALRDPVASAQMTPRDLLANNSGLPRHDLMFYRAPYSRAEIVRRLRYLEPTAGFRETYQYQNQMFTAAGYLIERVTKITWEDFVRRRILDPLGMADTNFSVSACQRSPDLASPHVVRDGAAKKMPFVELDAMSPAGGMHSNAADMARWLLMNLGGGELEGRRIVSRATLATIHSPQTVIPGSIGAPELLPQSYALGWIVAPYRGRLVVQHQGGIDGFKSMAMLLPRERAAVVVLTNAEKTPLPEIVSYGLVDRLLGLDVVLWNRRFLAAAQRSRAAAGAPGPAATSAAPAHALSSYAGEYEHGAYGRVSVVLADGALRVRFRIVDAPAIHRTGDEFEFYNDLVEGVQPVAFQHGASGPATSLSIPLEPAGAPIVFTRTRPQPAQERPRR